MHEQVNTSSLMTHMLLSRAKARSGRSTLREDFVFDLRRRRLRSSNLDTRTDRRFRCPCCNARRQVVWQHCLTTEARRDIVWFGDGAITP